MRGIATLPAAMLVMTMWAQVQADSVGYMPRKHLVKAGLTSVFVKTVSLNYERVLKDDLSVGMTVGWMVPSKPIGLLDLGTDQLSVGADRRMSGVYLTPEVKWFVERSDRRLAPRGLYVGGYARYGHTSYQALVSVEASGNGTSGSSMGDLRITLNEYGIGPMLGYQFLAIGDRLVVDLLFVAPRWSVLGLRVEAGLGGEGQLFEELEQALEDRLGRDVTSFNIDLSNSGTSTLDRNGLGMRAGIRIGYAF